MKAASFNINSVRARLDILLPWLQREKPDVLCLQETKVQDEDFPVQVFSEAGYSVAFKGQKSYNGVAILSTEPLHDIHIGFDNEESSGPRIISAVFQNINIINTYIPQGGEPDSEKFQGKLDWLKRLLEYFQERFTPEQPVLWMGDFNIAPEPGDVYDPVKLLGQTGYHPDEHALLKKFAEWGFADVFRRHVAETEQFTFWDYRIRNSVSRNIGWKLDHIWATSPLAQKSTRAWIDMNPRLKERPSDHTPILAEFDLHKDL